MSESSENSYNNQSYLTNKSAQSPVQHHVNASNANASATSTHEI